jgi:hypothetical protein
VSPTHQTGLITAPVPVYFESFAPPTATHKPTVVVTWLNANGAKADFWFLADRGIVGNGHMLMLEDNSDAIADIMLEWLGAFSGKVDTGFP